MLTWRFFAAGAAQHLFLIADFCFAMQSSRRVHKNTVIINVSHGSGWESLVGVSNSVSSISCEGCSFLGAPRTFGALFSFSSFSSTSTNPSGRVQDQDRRELSGSCVCCCCCLWRGLSACWGLLLLIPRIPKGGDCILGWVVNNFCCSLEEAVYAHENK